MSVPKIRIGIDENGMGPRLGPMLVTAVWAETDVRGHRKAEQRARGKMLQRVGDSKGLVRHGDVALGEAWARTFANLMGEPVSGVDSLIDTLSLAPAAEREELCPEHMRNQCWNLDSEGFSAGDELLRAVRGDVEKMKKGGLRLLGAQAMIVCNKRLNQAADRGQSRFVVDLHAMERLSLFVREREASDVLAVCGKVGAMRQYEPFFGPLGGRLRSVLEEKREQSAYYFPQLGELRFVMDADDSDRLVSLASLVGKYLREVLMGKIAAHYRAHDASLPSVSGYHDPVTTRFIDATSRLRKKLKTVDDCFLRRKLGTG